jgi:polynucleotide 5'-hydroxyl-kinase GRC3/NOL9
MAQADDAALEAAARVRVTLILGAGDTGKTTLTARLAGALASRGGRVAVVDADVGQSEIGPPTTIGLGEVTAPLVRLRDSRLLALEFIGDTSPVRHIGHTAEATGRLVRRAVAAQFDHVLIDTGGLVQGALGLALKRAKVAAVEPDLVLVIQRAAEAEPLLAALAGRARAPVVRVPAAPGARRRTQTERRLHREAALEAYMRAARALVLPPSSVEWRGAVETRPPLARGLLVGFYDPAGEALGVGAVESVEGERVTIVTPVEPARIGRVVAGRATWSRES